MVALDNSAVEKGHDGKAATEDEQPRLGEVKEYLQKCASLTRETESAGHEQRTRGAAQRQAGRHRFDQHRNEPTEEKEPDDFSRSPGGGDTENEEDGPQQFVLSESQLRQFECRAGNDADHSRANPIEHALHPWKSAK